MARPLQTVTDGPPARPEGQTMRRYLPAAATVAAVLLSFGAAAAPPGQDGAINFRAGGFFPAGNSDFWDEKENDFTLDHSDLNGLAGSLGYTASMNNYFEFDVNADIYAASTRASDADFVDQNGDQILHDTRLSIVPITVGFRILPAGRFARRGAEGQRYVRRPVPYLGAGVGMSYWQYEEEGDFVFLDPSSPSGVAVFYDRHKETGLEFEKHAQIGIEFPVAPDWNITLEVRRSWAEASLSDLFPSAALTFDDPRRLDLGGVFVFVGASLRF
jgi:hypothetical protein